MKRILSIAVWLILLSYVYSYSAAQVTVFTIPGCGKCAYVINYLKNHNISYIENTSSDPDHGKKLWEVLKSAGKYNGGTVYGPTVVINGKVYFNIENLESFTASIPSLISGENSSLTQNQNQDIKDSDPQFIKSITERHNYHRENHGVAALKWNTVIQKYAQSWADKIASEDKMYHRQPNNYGENIYWKSGGDLSGAEPVDAWYSEIKSYNYNNPGFSMATGHFTQVVWAGSSELGCGKARSKRGGTYIVCNYNPPGNYQGMFPGNVLPLKSAGGGAGNTDSNNGANTAGQKTIKYSNGSVYTGIVKNGRLNGRGIMKYSNGDVYEGEWKDGNKDGYGTYKWKSGSWYQGYYKNNKYNGKGTLYANGKQQKGNFKDGKFIGN